MAFIIFFFLKKLKKLKKLELSPQNFRYDVLYPLYSASSEVILRHNALTRLARRAFCHISDRSIYPLEAETHRKDISPVM